MSSTPKSVLKICYNRKMKDIAASVDIGSKNIKIVVASKNNKGLPEILVATSEVSQGIRNGQISDFSEAFSSIQKAIKKTEKHLGKNIQKIILGINSFEIKSQVVKIKQSVAKSSNEVTELDLEKAEREAISKMGIDSPYEIINNTLSSVFLDGKKISGNIIGKIGNNIETHFLMQIISKKTLESFLQIFEKLNINIAEIVYSSYGDSIPLTTKRERIYGVCLVNIGAENTSIAIYENEMPILTKIVKIGGNNITNDIAVGLNMSLEDAEETKKRNKSTNKKIVDNIIEARLKDISDTVKSEILKINNFGKLTGGLVLTGGTARLENINEIFTKNMEMNVKNANNILPKITDGILRDGVFSTSYGLTFLSTEDKTFSEKLYSSIKLFIRKILASILP
jgi:cell division protein FtsA